VITKRKREMDKVFFSFPKDSNLRKVWTHYCKRWNFVPGPSHRLCSAHFSNIRTRVYIVSKTPLLKGKLAVNQSVNHFLLKNYQKNKWRHTDAVPSIPLTVSREVKEGRPIQLPMPRAFEKRRKANVSKFMHILARVTARDCLQKSKWRCNQAALGNMYIYR
jgi:hypothetical protein